MTRTPATIILLIVLLALVEPLTHFWIMTAPPEGMVPTGVHTGDSAHHIVAMQAFINGGYSPYVSCDASPYGLQYFSATIFYLYAILGQLTHLLGITPFIALGLINGLAGALYLWCTWRLFRLIMPPFAETAFYLFALGGGLGGILYGLALLFGLDADPRFQDAFLRFAAYDLIEGQHRSPLLLMPRAYYTIPMALGIASLTAFIESERIHCRAHLFFAGFLLFFCTLINLRIGPVIWVIALLYMILAAEAPRRERIIFTISYGLYAFSGALLFYAVLLQHPSYGANVYNVGQQIMGLIPFMSATLFFWPPLINALGRITRFAPTPVRILLGALLGYLAAYCILYLGYQAYWGNLLIGGDVKAGTIVSDWALIGAILGGAWYQFRVPRLPFRTNPTALWLACWFLGLLVISLSAWAGGWTIRFAPQRFMLLLPLPMALLTAYGLHSLPRITTRLSFGLSIACGTLSLLVASLFFQGHVGKQNHDQPFAYLHYAHMDKEDHALIQSMDAGFVLTPPWSPIAFGEILAQHQGLRIVGGPGAMNLGDLPFADIQADVAAFWHATTPEVERREILDRRCVDYIYCPATAPADPATIETLHTYSWLQVQAEAVPGIVFKVIR